MLHEAIHAGVLAALRGLCVGMPGRLEKYDPATGRGEVKPLIKEQQPDGSFTPIHPISGVPVSMMGGATAAIYLPPAVGDTGWLAFSHRSMELWLARGGDVEPGDPRVMDLSDAVFWPGLRPFSEGSLAQEPDAAFIRNGDAKLKLRGDKVALGNSKAELLALFDELIQLLITSTVPTMLGPQQLTAVTSGQMLQLKQKLALIMGAL